ncbi:S-adenosyl-L-methionine-dependent methyltransferase, partial [Polychaeton citri CBS 116435]
LAGGLAYYCVSLYIAATQPCRNPNTCELEHQKDVASVYDTTADGFDSEVSFSEWIGGVNKVRKQLAKRCRGDVLEVSCGTGRNLGYYDLSAQGVNAINSLTFVDLSPQMIDVCKRKWAVLFDSKKRAQRADLSVRFLVGSALEPMAPAPTMSSNGKVMEQTKRYTTIFQTMGLCSTPSPAPLIENMAAHLDFSNPDARIYLLEHGRSYTQWLNRILDNSAEKHADIHGCWFNRDIGGLVDEAARKAGLEVVWERRHNLGTIWVFELKPSTS